MPGIGIGELAIIFLALLVFLGPKRLPKAARTFGRVMGEVRRATDELKTALYLEEARSRRADPARDPYRRARNRSGTAGREADGTRVREVESPDTPPAAAPAGADPAAVPEPAESPAPAPPPPEGPGAPDDGETTR